MFVTDKPITSFEEDKLGRSLLVKGLVSAIYNIEDQNNGDSMVIGLQGDWGSGKTSILNLVKKEIELLNTGKQNGINQEYYVLDFNPWMFSDTKDIIRQFFSQLSSLLVKFPDDEDIGLLKYKLKKTKKESRLLWLKKLSDILKKYGDTFALLGNPWIESGMKALKKTVNNRAKNLNYQKEMIIKTLKEEPIKIIVIIDDIDRLQPKEIDTVFQLVKKLGDFPNIIYLLSYDYNVIINSIKTVHEIDGHKYLEKIIQFPIKVPNIEEKELERICDNRLDLLRTEVYNRDGMVNQIDQSCLRKLKYFVLYRYIKTIRDANRFINAFEMKLSLLGNDVDFVDLLGITCLEVFENDLYSDLFSTQGIFCDDCTEAILSKSEHESKMANTLNSMFDKGREINNIEAAKNAVGILFPQTRKTMSLSFGVYDDFPENTSSLANNKIRTISSFERYFTLKFTNDIPQNIFMGILYHYKEEKIRRVIRDINRNGNLCLFKDKLYSFLKDGSETLIKPNRLLIILRVLASQCHKFEFERKESKITFGINDEMIPCLSQIISKFPQKDIEWAIKLLCYNSQIRAYTYLLLAKIVAGYYKRKKDEDTISKESIVLIDSVKRLKTAFIDRFVFEIYNSEFYSDFFYRECFSALDQFDPIKSKDLKRIFASNDESMLKMISWYYKPYYFDRIKQQNMPGSVDLEAINEYSDLLDICQRIRSLSQSKENSKNRLKASNSIFYFMAAYNKLKLDKVGNGLQIDVFEKDVMKYKNIFQPH